MLRKETQTLGFAPMAETPWNGGIISVERNNFIFLQPTIGKWVGTRIFMMTPIQVLSGDSVEIEYSEGRGSFEQLNPIWMCTNNVKKLRLLTSLMGVGSKVAATASSDFLFDSLDIELNADQTIEVRAKLRLKINGTIIF